MMKDIKIVIGANAGDEGKGLMTDYFSQKPNSIVVCSNGGSQRGHTVMTPDGIRHVFHHFGSGTFNGAVTYLPKEFIVNPLIFVQEFKELINKGVVPIVYAHSDCMVSTPYDMMANHIVEENRGKQKHGSCGLGIFETIKRYESDITDFDKVKDYYLEKFEKEGIVLSDSWKKLFNDQGIYEHFLEDLDFMNDHIEATRDESFLNIFDHIIFEAAQGLLLDQNNLKYFPHLTPSNTGLKNPKEIIERVNWNDELNIEVCYVTRTYLTRHGAGPFPTECNKDEINAEMYDKTNVPNPHQDTLRYGKLVLNKLYQRVIADVGDFECERSITITHCNEFRIDDDKFGKLFSGWNIYKSDGETHNDILRYKDGQRKVKKRII